MKEPILVTGGAGYIGSHTCKKLAASGFLPIAYDNLSTGHGYAVKWGPFIEGDLNDSAKLDLVFSTYQPKAVLHFAASALAYESVVNPGKYYQNNIGSTLSLLESMRKAKVLNLVFSSTCATYGDPKATPITEEHPQVPISPYGRTKWMIEQMLDDFEFAYGLQSVKLRYFNAAGADGASEIGENHDPETHLIPSIIETALNLRKEIIVYGTDFPTHDGSAVRDYIHVQDLADAHVRALNYLLARGKGTCLNLGTGQGSSVLELIEAIQTYTGKAVVHRIEPRRSGEPSLLIASAKKAKEVLGWTPVHSDLSTIIGSAWKWHQFLFKHRPLLKNAARCLDSKQPALS
jgi:UDP-glucose-4-epimerase GalE